MLRLRKKCAESEKSTAEKYCDGSSRVKKKATDLGFPKTNIAPDFCWNRRPAVCVILANDHLPGKSYDQKCLKNLDLDFR